MSDDCIGGKMLVALAEPEQTKLACPVCGATGLTRASVINGHGVIPHHGSVPFRSNGVIAATSRVSALTPSEVALAKVLAAWDEWPGSARDDAADALFAVRDALARHGMMIAHSSDDLSSEGRALLDRAKKAGVL